MLHHEFVSLSLYDPEREQLRVHVLDFAEGKGLVREGISMRVEDAPSGLALRTRRPVPLTIGDIERRFDSEYARGLSGEGIKSGCGFPLVAHGRLLGTLAVASLTEETFPEADVELLKQVRAQFDEEEVVNLTLAVGAINTTNRLNIAFRTEAGGYQPGAWRHAAA